MLAVEAVETLDFVVTWAMSHSNPFPSVRVCVYVYIHICTHGEIHRNMYKYVYIYVSLLLCFSLEPWLLSISKEFLEMSSTLC